MTFYYSGINCSSLYMENNESAVIVQTFRKIEFQGLRKFEIGWNFSLLWKNDDLYVSGKIRKDVMKDDIELLKIPHYSGRYKNATIDPDTVYVLTEDNTIWQYKVYEKEWKKVPNFLIDCEGREIETVVQMITTRCTWVLTNLGRVYSIPTLIDMPKRLKFIQIAGGFDHTIMLSADGEVYSMGMGTRGQLGHDDLEDCETPKKIEALSGLKIVHISAGGWHSAVITDQGDIYTWGWNTNGELGQPSDDVKICATPRVVDFKDEKGEDIEVNVKKVECGNNFTVCLSDNGTLWGCGSNKYGQLGLPVENLQNSPIFIPLKMALGEKKIMDFWCREWGTCVLTN